MLGKKYIDGQGIWGIPLSPSSEIVPNWYATYGVTSLFSMLILEHQAQNWRDQFEKFRGGG